MSNKFKYGKFFICQFFIAFLFSFTTSHAQVKSVFQFLGGEQISDLTLSLDLTGLIEQKKTNNYMPATLTADSGEKFSTEVRPRGKYRRRICDVPPLKIKFKKKQLQAMGLDTFNEVRLALPCLDNADAEAILIREYLAYRIFEQLSPQYHAKARLIRLSLHDTHTDKKHKAVYAMLIEHEEELAGRLGGTVEETYNLPLSQLHENQMALNAMFQYLIGNTDWDIQMVRNVYPFKPAGSDKYYLIPYDFDFSGLVSAPYAKVSADLGIKNVRERKLMAEGISEKAMNAARRILEVNQQAILECTQLKALDLRHRDDVYRYLETFYEQLNASKIIPEMMKDIR